MSGDTDEIDALSAPRLVVVTSSLADSEIEGVIALAADAPDIPMLRALFEEHIQTDAPRTCPEKAFISWLVDRGFAQRVEVIEWNVDVFTAGKEPEVTISEHPCPRYHY